MYDTGGFHYGVKNQGIDAGGVCRLHMYERLGYADGMIQCKDNVKREEQMQDIDKMNRMVVITSRAIGRATHCRPPRERHVLSSICRVR